MANTMTKAQVNRATCVWKSNAKNRLKRCIGCDKQTTGRVVDVRACVMAAFCENCARGKGLA